MLKQSLETGKHTQPLTDKDHKSKTPPVQAILEAYRKVKMSHLSEAMSETLIGNCIYVHQHAFKNNPEIVNIVLASDNKWGKQSPMSQISILAAMVRRGKNAGSACIRWLFNALMDGLDSGELLCGGVSERDITGKNHYGKCLADVFLLKKESLAHLVGAYLDEMACMDIDTKRKIRNVMSSHEEFRKSVPFPERTSSGKLVPKQPNLGWAASLPRVFVDIACFIGDVVYTPQYNKDLTSALRQRKAGHEIMDVGGIAEQAELLKTRLAVKTCF